jgi:phospholipid N-methyltransferase
MDKHSTPGDIGVVDRFRDAFSFLTQFIRDPGGMAAPLPSTRGVADAVRRELEEVGARRVVELGAGLGSLTRGILQAMGPEQKLLCIERRAGFCERLKERFNSQLEVVCGDALQVRSIIAGTPWERPDAIVSSVPLVIDRAGELCREVAEALPKEGLYIQLANFRKPIKTRFKIQRTYWFLLNMPPEQLHSAVPNGRAHGEEG